MTTKPRKALPVVKHSGTDITIKKDRRGFTALFTLGDKSRITSRYEFASSAIMEAELRIDAFEVKR